VQRITFRSVSFIAVALFVFGLSGCRKSTDVIELKLGHSLDVEHPVHRAMIFMGERLKLYHFSWL
jgi:hypothetical protein